MLTSIAEDLEQQQYPSARHVVNTPLRTLRHENSLNTFAHTTRDTVPATIEP